MGNLGKRGWPSSVWPGKRNVQMNLLNQEKKGVGKPNLSIKDKRLLNQRQYQNETRHIIVFTQAFCWKWTFFCACICLSFYTIIGLSCNCFCVVYMNCKTNHIMSWSKILIPRWIYHSEQSTCHVVYYCWR